MNLRRVLASLTLLAMSGGLPHAQGADDVVEFAVVGRGHGDATAVLRAIAQGPAQFVVDFDLAKGSAGSCADAALERRRAELQASPKPVVPIVAAVSWSDCGNGTVEASSAAERLTRVGDAFFDTDESAGQAALRWARQSTTHRFGRYRENVRWMAGGTLFATFNLPNNNNDYRIGAGRNGEFEERSIANRAWLDRAFRMAYERRLSTVVLFVDAAPRFHLPMRAPEMGTRDRDGFHEWKLALRDHLAVYTGKVLLVQGHGAGNERGMVVEDHPLKDPSGRPLANLTRVVVPEPAGGERWLRVIVDPRDARRFRVTSERFFDDPSGELYGGPRNP